MNYDVIFSVEVRDYRYPASGILHQEAALHCRQHASLDRYLYRVRHGQSHPVLVEQSYRHHHAGLLAIHHHIIESQPGIVFIYRRDFGSERNTRLRVARLVIHHIEHRRHVTSIIEYNIKLFQIHVIRFAVIVALRIVVTPNNFRTNAFRAGTQTLLRRLFFLLLQFRYHLSYKLLKISGYKLELGQRTFHIHDSTHRCYRMSETLHFQFRMPYECVTIVIVSLMLTLHLNLSEVSRIIIEVIRRVLVHEIRPDIKIVSSLVDGQRNLSIQIRDIVLRKHKSLIRRLRVRTAAQLSIRLDHIADMIVAPVLRCPRAALVQYDELRQCRVEIQLQRRVCRKSFRPLVNRARC